LYPAFQVLAGQQNTDSSSSVIHLQSDTLRASIHLGIAMKRIIHGMFAASVLYVASEVQARPLAEIQANGGFNVVTTAAAPPHGFKNPVTQQLEGMMVDVASAVARHLSTEINLSAVPFSELIPALTSSRADMISAPFFITEARSKIIAFSEPVYGWGEGVVISIKNTREYPDFASLQGQRVGVLTGSVQFDLTQELPSTEVSTYPNYAQLLSDLLAGRIDLGVVDPPSILLQIQSLNIPGVRLYPGYKPRQLWQVGIAVQKSEPALLEAINAALKTMKNSGELETIGRKWGASNLISP